MAEYSDVGTTHSTIASTAIDEANKFESLEKGITDACTNVLLLTCYLNCIEKEVQPFERRKYMAKGW